MMETTQTKPAVRKNALGRGLSALIPASPARPEPVRAAVLEVPIEAISRDPRQPRQHFGAEALKELAASIRTRGIIHPILLRRENGQYFIIAGERRWRAAQLAGLREVPALVRDATPHDAFEIALIENLQREDLSPIEEAEGYKRLLDEHGLNQEEIAQRVGKDRSSVANALRLLNLPREIKDALIDGRLNMGHARALLGIGDGDQMRRVAREVIAQQLSVRATEQLVRHLKGSASVGKSKETPSVQVKQLIERLQRALGTKVRLFDHGGKGKLEISYVSYADLQRVIDAILSR
jgi:ParB family transcriptional regulator, chromosome partitioning protein